MNKIVLQLETLTCPSCVRRIEATLSKQPGIEVATVKFNASKVDVTYQETIINATDIKQLVESIGYKVTDVK